MLLAEIKRIFHQELDALYPDTEVDAFFYRMLEHYTCFERFVLVVQPEVTLSKEEEQPFFEGLSRLKKEEPLQYILGQVLFKDINLLVNKHVLIPRPETEELVDWVLEEWDATSLVSPVVLDIGTGSGCIAIALSKALPKAKVFASDISKKALDVAEKNARLNAVDIIFVRSDILKPQAIPMGEFDIIVSNPPYVRESEKREIWNNVKKYEPELALFVPDKDPLLYYKAIAAFAHNYLKTGGSLFLEINQYLGKETVAMLETLNFGGVELKKDIFGKNRMIKISK
ncbi:MAG: peptide chain release factor N(5)-glutamine methyltransferase [Bacteroidota bacterium]